MRERERERERERAKRKEGKKEKRWVIKQRKKGQEIIIEER